MYIALYIATMNLHMVSSEPWSTFWPGSSLTYFYLACPMYNTRTCTLCIWIVLSDDPDQGFIRKWWVASSQRFCFFLSAHAHRVWTLRREQFVWYRTSSIPHWISICQCWWVRILPRMWLTKTSASALLVGREGERETKRERERSREEDNAFCQLSISHMYIASSLTDMPPQHTTHNPCDQHATFWMNERERSTAHVVPIDIT